MTEKQSQDLQRVIKEISTEYEKALTTPYVFKPMAYTLYKVWSRWDSKEHKRIMKGE